MLLSSNYMLIFLVLHPLHTIPQNLSDTQICIYYVFIHLKLIFTNHFGGLVENTYYAEPIFIYRLFRHSNLQLLRIYLSKANIYKPLWWTCGKHLLRWAHFYISTHKCVIHVFSLVIDNVSNTNYVYPMLLYCWVTVCDGGPPSQQHRVNIKETC